MPRLRGYARRFPVRFRRERRVLHKSLFKISLHPPFWRIFRHASLNFLAINKLLLREFISPDKKIAQYVKYKQILNRL